MQRSRNPGEGFPVVPKDEAKCVWMMAGIVLYKLCERNYQCESCPLDSELRHAGTQIDDGVAAVDPGFQETVFFGHNHTWVRLNCAEQAVIGLDDFIVRLFDGVQQIVLPPANANIIKGARLALIIQEDETFIVAAPLSGKVIKANPELMSDPRLLSQQQLDRSWLVQLRPNRLLDELGDLLMGKRATTWQQTESIRLEQMIGPGAENVHHRLGPVMHDGRAGMHGLLESLGPERYRRIVNSFLTLETPEHPPAG